jgi:hypothetical protein
MYQYKKKGEEMIEVNLFAVLLAAVASMGVGFLWYSPMMFGKPWMKLMGLTMKDMNSAKKEMGKLYALSFVASIVTAYVLSHVMTLSSNFYDYDQMMTGMTSAFWMWLGFIAPVQLTDTIFGGKKWKLFALNTGYQLVAVMAMGVVLALL